MDPEFQRALTIVLLVGGAIGAIAGVTLFIIFRQFGEENAGKSSHVGLMAALLGFVFLVCAGLFMLAYAEK
jgi:hypothetical protein